MISQERRSHSSQHPVEADSEKQFRNYSHPHQAQRSVRANSLTVEANRKLRLGLNPYNKKMRIRFS